MWETHLSEGAGGSLRKKQKFSHKESYCFIQSKYVINLDESPCFF